VSEFLGRDYSGSTRHESLHRMHLEMLLSISGQILRDCNWNDSRVAPGLPGSQSPHFPLVHATLATNSKRSVRPRPP
jgi:hypothetical protein